MTSITSPTRPTLALRIGITGARNLDAAQLPRLSDQLHAVLQAIQQQMRQLAAQDHIAAAYHHQGGPPRPTMRFLSPLARGADRLAAQAAVSLGYTLHVPMPFPQSEYERDFTTPEDLTEFRTLLTLAGDDRLALDGDHGPWTNRAYEGVGRYVVRHSDIVIAIWDGEPSSGRGGTADIVRFAATAGVPVWWVHATQDRAPVWLADIQDLRDPMPDPPSAETSLHAFLQTLIPPPAPSHRHRRGIIGRLARLWQGPHVSPEIEHFAEQEHKRRWPWKAYATLIRWTSGLDLPWTGPHPPADPAARYWFDRYEPADARAGEYAAHYRSAYVWVFLLGTLALIFGALALLFSLWHSAATGSLRAPRGVPVAFMVAEFLALLLILALVCLGTRQDWHEHSIEYRLLAELYRKQQTLTPLGWVLPITAVRSMATADHGRPDRAAWVAWLFAAEQRAGPMPRGALANAALAHAAQGAPRATALMELIAEQRTYHIDRWKMAEAAGSTLEHLGVILFGAVLLCVVGKLLLAEEFEQTDWIVLLGFLATVLPGVSAAFVGIRAYAELQLLAEQSHHMVAELERANHRVERLNPQRPLVSQDIGAEAALVATLMLQDLEGWARLFRVKGMELS
jgi:hypothetical protein